MKLSDLQRYSDQPFGVGRDDNGPYLLLSDVEKLLKGERIIKPCPCCGNRNPVLTTYPPQENEVYTYHSDRFSVLCRYDGDGSGCGLESGHYKTADEAIEAWERRTR